MKLCVFLGNPGAEYAHTRHNVGFLFVDFLQTKWDFNAWQEIPKFHGVLCEGKLNRGKIIFLKPTTFMNLSGKAVLAVAQFYKIAHTDILIIYDDKDLPFGSLRFREKGTSGGHKGMQSCIETLGSTELKRIKIGIDTAERQRFAETADFVLAKFTAEEMAELPGIFEKVEEMLREKL